jgi:hypothetical protein
MKKNKNQSSEEHDNEVERVLQAAKIVARWKKRPFYVS